MNGKIIGVDFSGEAISVALVTYGKGEYRVTACDRIPLASTDQWQDFARAIAGIQEKVDMRDVTCIAALPDDWLSHRIISLPFTDRRKINKVVKFEL